ncbi:PREDICTED: RNA-binding protein 7 isoform X1 [Dipodomys ordii]|uniref:RNA-binding protein 7 n=2 Tax=Dipodomys ordii TaxID=10020 RepID=A0A1S3EMJ4_DIPOR|nr:PREDICTED: RNA-binding protein 7 isoform X1 [Dipodomys ordii]
MGAAAAEADRTLFVGNLETKVTEELLFELFHQAGPVIKVKIPKDKDGKPKQFAFVNFKHEVSVPYAMNLLNGIKLFGRPIKIQFRSGSSHASQDVSPSYPQHQVVNSSPTSTSPTRYERTVDNMTPSSQIIQRSFSSPENYQRQAVMNSVLRQMSYGGKFGSMRVDQSGFSSSVQSHGHNFNQSSSSQWRQDTPSSQRKVRQSSHPYLADRHYSQPRYTDHGPDYHYRGIRDDFFYEDRSPDGWNHDYDNRRDISRDGKWHLSRH